MKNIRYSIFIGLGVNLIKLLAIYILMVKVFHRPDYFIHFHGDSMSYFEPVINLIEKGSYDPDYRMPGYGFLYYIFFLMSHSNDVSFFLIILTQFIVTGIANGLIAQMVFDSTKSRFFYFLSFILLGLNYYLLYDTYLSTESLATSLLIIISFGCYRYDFHPILMGISLCWLIFLKSIFCLLFVPLFFYLYRKKHTLKYFLLLFFPIILIEGSWILRNALKFQTFVPLTLKTFYPEGLYGGIYGFQSVQEVIRSYGGSHQFWRIDSDAAWYFSGGFAEPKFIQGIPYPNFNFDKLKEPNSHFFTSQINLDSLLKLKYALTSIYLTTVTTKDQKNIPFECDKELSYIRKTCPLYVKSIQVEKPFLYYIQANINRLKYTFFTNYFFDNVFRNPTITERLNPFLSKLLDLFTRFVTGMMWFFSSFSLLISLYFLAKWKNHTVLTWCTYLNLYTIFFYVFIFKQAEERYFCVLYPIWILMSLTVIHRIFYYLKRKWK